MEEIWDLFILEQMYTERERTTTVNREVDRLGVRLYGERFLWLLKVIITTWFSLLFSPFIFLVVVVSFWYETKELTIRLVVQQKIK